MTLNCLLQDAQAIKHAKDAISHAGRKLDSSKEKVSIKNIQKILSKEGIHLNNETIADLYGEVFNQEIDKNANFETSQDVAKVKGTPTPISKKITDAFLKDFSKENKKGEKVLDWKKLMNGKTETEKRDAIDSLGLNLSQNETNELLDRMNKQWSLILAKSFEKATKTKNISNTQRNAIQKLAEIVTLNAEEEFENTYNEAIAKTIGVSSKRTEIIKKIRGLKKKLDLISNNPNAVDSVLAKQVQDDINELIHEANTSFENSGSLSMANAISKWVDLSLMAMLNNVGGVAQNILTGLSSLVTRGAYDVLNGNTKTNEIGTDVGLAYLANVSVHNATGFGDVSTTFSGQNDAVKSLTKIVTRGGKGIGSKAFNSIVNLITGVTFLNGADAGIKAKASWMRFIENSEKLLMARRNIGIKEARKILNEQLFGKSWEDMKGKAKKTIEELNAKGADIEVTDATITILASDMIRMQLVDNRILTQDDVINAWESSVKVAGLSMGHVSNNPLSTMMNLGRRSTQSEIEKQIKQGNYKSAALLTLGDIIAFKVLGKFVGGGTNWMILTAETAGLGIVTGGIGLMIPSTKLKNLQHISSPSVTNKDIRDYLIKRQKNIDALTRGTTGLAIIALFLLLNASDDDDKKELLSWFDKHPDVKKTAIKTLPSLLAWYMTYIDQAKQNQESPNVFDKESMKEYKKDLSNIYKYNESRNYLLNMFNQRLDGGTLESVSKAYYKSINTDSEEKKKLANQAIGNSIGRFFPLNPLPTRGIIKYIDYEDKIHNTIDESLSGFSKGFAEGSGIIKKEYKKD